MLGDDLSSLVARSSDQTEHPSEAVLVDVVFEGKAGCGVELFHHRTEALLRRPVLGTLRGLLSDLHRRAEAQGHLQGVRRLPFRSTVAQGHVAIPFVNI